MKTHCVGFQYSDCLKNLDTEKSYEQSFIPIILDSTSFLTTKNSICIYFKPFQAHFKVVQAIMFSTLLLKLSTCTYLNIKSVELRGDYVHYIQIIYITLFLIHNSYFTMQ